MKRIAFFLAIFIILSDVTAVHAGSTVDSGSAEALEIVQQPEIIYADVNETVVFSTSANKKASYLWMRSKDGGVTWEKAFYDGYKTANMSVQV